ncbi:antitoxin [Candidatus Termititenax aidoneus]|uniref:Antitoxin n=1 Tax=Termititenax aidoneus TaxID=2218524 RepID=A0A388TDN5_TERA1|nr:antitoxin [Candidatus Termititenax aidoneus]
MGKIKTYKWDAADYLKTEEDIADYLAEIFKDNNPALELAAIGDVAKARKTMKQSAKKANVGVNSLYKSLSKTGTPYFKTVSSVLNCLGFRLSVVPLEKAV